MKALIPAGGIANFLTVKLTVWTTLDDVQQSSDSMQCGATESSFYRGLTIKWE